MPRNGSGVQIPPTGTSPLLPNTTADANMMESRIADIENEITGSLPRNGVVGMSAPLIASVGSLGAPGITFSGDTDSGFALISGRLHFIKDGVSVFSIGASDVAFSQAAAFNGAVNLPPPGSLFGFAGSAAPTGYLLCAGQAVSRTTFAALFAAILTTYGAGDGSTTFNVPDFRGRTLVGLDNMGGSDASRMVVAGSQRTTLGGVFGADTHTLTSAQMPNHGHTGSTGNAGAHTHSGTVTETGAFGGTPLGATYGGGGFNFGSYTVGLSIVGVGDHAHPVTINNAGGDQAHPNVQPSAFCNIIIKT